MIKPNCAICMREKKLFDYMTFVLTILLVITSLVNTYVKAGDAFFAQFLPNLGDCSVLTYGILFSCIVMILFEMAGSCITSIRSKRRDNGLTKEGSRTVFFVLFFMLLLVGCGFHIWISQVYGTSYVLTSLQERSLVGYGEPFFLTQIAEVSYGIQYVYLIFLHLVFSLFGNNVSVALCLQALLQNMGIIFLCLGTLLYWGVETGIFSVLILFLYPDFWILNTGLYEENLLVFLLGFLFFLSGFLFRGGTYKMQWLISIPLGCSLGIFVWLDGKIIFLFILFGFLALTHLDDCKAKFLTISGLILFTIVGFTFMCAASVGFVFSDATEQLWNYFQAFTIYPYSGYPLEHLAEASDFLPVNFVLPLTILWIINSPWKEAGNRKLYPFLYCGIFLEVFSCTFQNETDWGWVWKTGSLILCTCGFYQLFYAPMPVDLREDIKEQKNNHEVLTPEMEKVLGLNEGARVIRKVKDTRSTLTIDALPDTGRDDQKLIASALSLPKKHEKKSLEFPYSVEESKLCYDIEVADTDDFDYE